MSAPRSPLLLHAMQVQLGRVAKQSQLYDHPLSLPPPSVHLPVPNKSKLLLLLPLLLLSRLQLRPFLSDHDPSMLSNWATVALGPK